MAKAKDLEVEKAIPEKPAGSEMERLIEQLRRVKKEPKDWVFVPRRKHHEKARVMLADGESTLMSDGGGGFKSRATKQPTLITVFKVRAVAGDGTIHGGYHPQAEGDLTAQQVLDACIKLSLRPDCEVVPYEARELGKEAKDSQAELLLERKRRQDAEDKLRNLEAAGVTPERFKELEDQIAELTKPPKKPGA